MVRDRTLHGPIAFTRDHLDAASVASPYRETENMLDGSDAVADWPLLNALFNVACRADLVTIHSVPGGRAGYGMSSGTTVIADRTEARARRLERTLNAETGLGVLRYADAGYEMAIETAKVWCNI
jgi:urocanate hydratase